MHIVDEEPPDQEFWSGTYCGRPISVCDRQGRAVTVVLYHCYELGHAAWRPARMFVESYRLLLQTLDPLSHTLAGRSWMAACEAFERATRRYARPAFDITSTTIQGRLVPVHEQVVWQSPFCRLLHFKRDIETVRERVDPPLLLVAPMSGHFATLLRGTVQSFLPNHEVYVTDWQDARAVPLTDGHFDLDDYIETMAAIFRFFSGNIHVFAVCQPAVPVLAATALMEAAADPAVPLTLMLAGGAVDTRISPTAINRLAEERGVDWFSRNVITEVPWPAPGYGRLVYPGFLQLSGFMMMNLDRHVQAHKEMFMHLASGDGDSAQKHRTFYDEYLAVMDLTAEFFLQTVDTVFVRHALPQGRMTSRNRQIALAAIRRPALMTIEGENDNITGRGQCRAALKHCVNIPADRKDHFECPGVGHYGIFSGSRFKAQIVPRMAEFMRAHPHHP